MKYPEVLDLFIKYHSQHMIDNKEQIDAISDNDDENSDEVINFIIKRIKYNATSLNIKIIIDEETKRIIPDVNIRQWYFKLGKAIVLEQYENCIEFKKIIEKNNY
jgi:hypothetical protein